MKVNSLIKILTFSDVLIVSGWGLINPLFAVFLTQQIEGGSLELVGLSVAINLILRSSLQIPFARLIDSKKGEIDDFLIMATGSFLTSSAPFLYIFARKATDILFIQALQGIASAMSIPGWMAIFTRHIDKLKAAEEWGFYSSTVGITCALTGALGGFMAERFGFRFLYFIVGVISTFGSTFLFFVYQDLRKEEKRLKQN
jgi:MFS family permease